MTLDQNEKRLIEKLSSVLKLLNASKQDLKVISDAQKIDADFMRNAGKIFDKTEACSVCRHAFYSWRNTMDDETVISFIDDWINWKTQNTDIDSKSKTSK